MDLKELPSYLRDDKISEETKTLISSLPSHTNELGKKLCMYQGCWYYYNTLQGVLNFQRGFQPQDTDIILASFPKSGTTWLKALAVALLERSKNHPSSDDHPLLSDNPHGIVPFFELDMFQESTSPDMSKFSSFPRLFSTHMPLHTMQETLKDSPCKIVYICRDVKDTLISWWFFVCAVRKIEPTRSVLESRFNSFCSGDMYYGPEVNKTRKINKVDHKNYFRKGEVGDWKNYLTPEMESKIDMIIQEKLQGSGLKF